MANPDPEPGALRFQCQSGCTNCCEVSGYVYLTERDLKRMASHIGMPVQDFETRYVYRTRHLLRLRKPRAGQCHFLKGGGCSVHPVKPVQCRTFPFWPDLVEDRRQWRQTKKYCPGIGRGDLIQIGTALEIASEMKIAYPTMF